jgi:hypothetical protein
MRIFVGYGFGERDRWVKDKVFPLIEAFGSEPVGGEGLYGQAPRDGVRQRINSCDGLIAFATRRFPAKMRKKDGASETHVWVQQELAVAIERRLKVLEVREAGADGQEGIGGGLHRITYDPKSPIDCFVELAKALGEWHRSPKSEFLLIRDNLYQELLPFIDGQDMTCEYRIHQGSKTSEWASTRLVQRNRRFYLFAPELPTGSRIKTRLVVRGRTERVFLSDEVEIDVDSIAVAEVVRGHEAAETVRGYEAP